MRNWIFLIIVCVVGFVVHQIYTGPPQDTPTLEQTDQQDLPPIPQICEEEGDIFEDAINSHDLGKLTDEELTRITGRFQACLRNTGFTDAQVNRTSAGIKEAALTELAQGEENE